MPVLLNKVIKCNVTLNIMSLILYEHCRFSSVLLHSKVCWGKNCLYKLREAGIQFITKAERAQKISLARSIDIFHLVVPGKAPSVLLVLLHVHGTALSFASDSQAAPASRTELAHGSGNNLCQVQDGCGSEQRSRSCITALSAQ